MVQSTMKQACKYTPGKAEHKKETQNLTSPQRRKERTPLGGVKTKIIQGRKNLAKFRFVLIEGTWRPPKLDLQEADDLITDLNQAGKLNIHWFRWKTVSYI